MCRKLFVLTSLILVLALVSDASAALISHYKFDEAGGTYVNDSVVATLNDGQLLGNARFTPGLGVGTIPGNLGSLEVGHTYKHGESETSATSWKDRAQVPFSVTASAGTMALWATIEEDHYWEYYFGIKDTNPSSRRLQLASSNRFTGASGTPYVSAGLGADWERVPNDYAGVGQPPLYTWHHLALTWEATGGGNGNFQIYLLIAGEAGTTLINSGTYTGLTNLTYPLDIGADGDNHEKGIMGSIDDFRVYNHILTASEINALPGVPEPATIALLGLGGLALLRRRR